MTVESGGVSARTVPIVRKDRWKTRPHSPVLTPESEPQESATLILTDTEINDRHERSGASSPSSLAQSEQTPVLDSAALQTMSTFLSDSIAGKQVPSSLVTAATVAAFATVQRMLPNTDPNVILSPSAVMTALSTLTQVQSAAFKPPGTPPKPESISTTGPPEADSTAANPSSQYPTAPNRSDLVNQKVRADNRARKKRWREKNEERNKDNDLRCRVNKRARRLFGPEASEAKTKWTEAEFDRRKRKRLEKEARKQAMNGILPSTNAEETFSSVTMSPVTSLSGNSISVTTASEGLFVLTSQLESIAHHCITTEAKPPVAPQCMADTTDGVIQSAQETHQDSNDCQSTTCSESVNDSKGEVDAVPERGRPSIKRRKSGNDGSMEAVMTLMQLGSQQ